MKEYLSSIDDLSKEKYINKNKLEVVCTSFGGYFVFWITLNYAKRIKVFISHA